jgi:outer membrane protein OmpU
MTNLKKVGLTALAGSLVAVSAQAGSLSVSGGAEMSYTSQEHNTTAQSAANNNGNRFGIEKFFSFNGSGELDNGHTVSVYHGGPFDSFSSSTITYDMGDMGTLSYVDNTVAIGIRKIDDMMPTVYEEPWDGIDFTSEASGSGVVGRVGTSGSGFNYNYAMGSVTIDLGYSPSGNDSSVDDGGMSGDQSNAATASTPSSTGVAIQFAAMDGLNVFAGMGDEGADSATEEYEDEHSTYGLTYTMGAVTVGLQHSEIDDGAAGGTSDKETDMLGIAFAINDNLSISYGYQETEVGVGNTDQEITAYGVGYSMGGISIKAQRNEADRSVTVGAASQEYERTEILVGFAF